MHNINNSFSYFFNLYPVKFKYNYITCQSTMRSKNLTKLLFNIYWQTVKLYNRMIALDLFESICPNKTWPNLAFHILNTTV